MKETVEFRINYDFANLLFKEDEGKDLGQLNKSVKIVELSKDDPRYNQIPIISKKVKEKYGKGFFFGWQIKRKYVKNEIESAVLFQIKIKKTFEPSGEECGTTYDEKTSCKICKANRKQIGLLKLKKGTIPKKDIAKTIAGEIVVSEKFKEACKDRHLRGVEMIPIEFEEGLSSYYQLIAPSKLNLTNNTIAGGDIFNIGHEGSEATEFTVSGEYKVKLEEEVYKCPEGHLIGLNLLSEVFVSDSPLVNEYDFFSSNQKVGVRRGLLNPVSLYMCSPAFRKMVIEEDLTGFEFEVANVE